MTLNKPADGQTQSTEPATSGAVKLPAEQNDAPPITLRIMPKDDSQSPFPTAPHDYNANPHFHDLGRAISEYPQIDTAA